MNRTRALCAAAAASLLLSVSGAAGAQEAPKPSGDLRWNSPVWSTGYRERLAEDEMIAGLSKFWSEVRFNLATYDLTPGLDVDALYLEFLPRVRRAQSTREYYLLLAEMCARLRDGHTLVIPPPELRDELYAHPPLVTRLVEDRVLVTEVLDDALRAEGVVPGLEVLSVDGVPVRERGRRLAELVSASTPQDRDVKVYTFSLFGGPISQPAVVEFAGAGGERFTRRLARGKPGHRLLKPALEFRMLEGGVAYVALNTFNDENVKAAWDEVYPKVAASRALVVDLRSNGGGNGANGFHVLSYLTDEPFKTSAWKTLEYRPAYRSWGERPGWHEAPAGEVAPNGAHHYANPVAVLTSGRTYSAAEDFLVAFDTMKRGLIVGEPTGGSTGNPVVFPLPGGGLGGVCSKWDSYPDGRQFVGVGVRPHVAAAPTVADVRSGRDTVLEAALAALAGGR